MTAKEYLNGVRQKELRCRMLYEKIEELTVQASGLKAITYDKDRVQVSPANQMEDVIIKISEVKAEYKKEIDGLRKTIHKVANQIDAMPNKTYAEVLRLRYMQEYYGRRLTFEQIACMMYKSFDWVRHVHGAALQDFERRYLK